MARLFITVGYAENSSQPHLVYLGEDGAAQKAAAAKSPHPRLLHLANPVGIRKTNAAAEANAAAIAAARRKK